MRERNYLRDSRAAKSLEVIDGVIAKFPKDADTEMLYWRAQLQYDVGSYADAAATLRGAFAQMKIRPAAASRRIECGLLLCRSLLDAGDIEAASAAFIETLQPYENDDINVVLMRSLIRDS
jgi:hypothetical protein